MIDFDTTIEVFAALVLYDAAKAGLRVIQAKVKV